MIRNVIPPKLVLYCLLLVAAFCSPLAFAQTSVTTFENHTLLQASGGNLSGNILIQPRVSDSTFGAITRYNGSQGSNNYFRRIDFYGNILNELQWHFITGTYGLGFIHDMDYSEYATALSGEIYYGDDKYVHAVYTLDKDYNFKDSLKLLNASTNNIASSSENLFVVVNIHNKSKVNGTGIYGEIGPTAIPFDTSGPELQEYLPPIKHNGFVLQAPVYLETPGYRTTVDDLIALDDNGVVVQKTMRPDTNFTDLAYHFIRYDSTFQPVDTLSIDGDSTLQPSMHYDNGYYYLSVRKDDRKTIIDTIYLLDSNWNIINKVSGLEFERADVIGNNLILDNMYLISKDLVGGFESRLKTIGSYNYPISINNSVSFVNQPKQLSTQKIIGNDTIPVGFSGTYIVSQEFITPDFSIEKYGDILNIREDTYLDDNQQEVFSEARRSIVLELPYGTDFNTWELKEDLIQTSSTNYLTTILGKRTDAYGNVVWRIRYRTSGYQLDLDVYLKEACDPSNTSLATDRQEQQITTSLVADSLVWYANLQPIANSNAETITTALEGAYYAMSYSADGSYRCTSDTLFFSPCTTLPVQIENNTRGVLSLDTTAEAYQWIDENGKEILGAYKATYTPQTVGKYRCKVYHDGGCYTYTDFYNLTSTASIRDNIDAEHTPYPNPAHTRIFLPKASEYTSVKLYNAMGQEVSFSYLADNELDIAHLPQGVYTLQVNSAEGISYTFKVIKR